jgi:hypothetical protein
MIRNTVYGRTLRGINDKEDFSLDDWPTVDEGALDKDALIKYFNKKLAVKLYFDGEAAPIIWDKCHIQMSAINRMVRQRCMQMHSDGRIYGWRALVPGVHIVRYTRKKRIRVQVNGSGASGALRTLLQLESDFSRRLTDQILKTLPDKRLGQIRKPRHTVWAWFLKELRKLGYEVRNEWPFTAKTMGYSALNRYADTLLDENPKIAARILGGPQLAKKMETGSGIDRPITVPYQRVEMDAHKADGRFVVMIPQNDGGWSPRLIHRIWVIVLMEVTSRAVIGYYFSMNFEVNKDDVLRAIKHALSSWSQRSISFSNHAYLDEAALPSGHHDRYVGLCWDETSVDGALAETCATVKDKLKDVVGSTVMDPSHGFAQRRSKDDRPFIESFFKNLAGRGFQRLSNTTGGKPGDKQGRDPEKIAITSEFQLEYAHELLDVMIANYMATPHSSLGYRTPLQMLDFYASSERLPNRYADKNSIQSLLSIRKLCTVRGGYKEGRRPYVNFLGAAYSSDELGQRHDLVGKKIWVINHLEDDARLALSSTKEALPLGILRAHPPWHRTPHSLMVRSSINSMVRNRRFEVATGGDAIMSFMEFVESSPNGKLPLHPSYMELKRILLEHAEFRSGTDDLELAKNRLQEANSVIKTIGAKSKKHAFDGSSDLIKNSVRIKDSPQSHMPPMRKAAN